MALAPPAMTPAEIAANPLFAPPVRVTCYPCKTTLFVGETAPEGGADAVYSAAGCPKGTCPGKNPAGYPEPSTVDIAATVDIRASSTGLPSPTSVLALPVATTAAVAA